MSSREFGQLKSNNEKYSQDCTKAYAVLKHQKFQFAVQ